MEFDSGRFGSGGKSRLMVDVHEMTSDGYQTFNYQERDGVLGEVSVRGVSDNTAVTAFSSVMRSAQQHAEPEGLDARADRSSSATTS